MSGISNRRFVMYGIPFMVLLVGGSFALKEFAQLRYTFRKKRELTEAEGKALIPNLKEKKPTVDEEFEKLKKVDLDNWSNIRGPRPWEDSKTVQQQQKQQSNAR